MLGREVVERQQLHPVLLQAIRRPRPLALMHLDEVVEGAGGVCSGCAHPDLVQHRLRRRLLVLGQLVQHVHRLMHPAALIPGPRKDLRERDPEPQRAISSRQLRSLVLSAILQVQQQVRLRCLALALAFCSATSFNSSWKNKMPNSSMSFPFKFVQLLVDV